MNVAIVTTCPSGIATSIIAAGLLEKAAIAQGWQANIECHSKVTEVTALTKEQMDKLKLKY